MRFPSIKSLADDAILTLKRFPFEVLFALTGTIAATLFVERDDYLSDSFYTKIIMTANLGLLLSLAANLFVSSNRIKKGLIIKVIVAIGAACFVFIFNPQLKFIDGLRFLLLSLAFHLLVAFAGFVTKGHIQGFWQFNKTLFLRFLTSMLYSGVLYLGLAAAIGASNFLFNLHLGGKVYSNLFFWIAGIFNTLFFLAGVPANTVELDNDDTYPKGLKVFTQYVLIPLASVYLVILLAYEVKILIAWNLPKGAVSLLVLGYAVFGILSILLIYPLRDREENNWIKIYARSFYFLLIPLLVLLCLAIYSRIMPYGITPLRYFLIVLAGWLLFITMYFLLSRKQNIKIIPASLAILALLSVYGPQSAFSIAKYSQRSILTGIFKKYRALNNGKITSLSEIKLSPKDGEKAIEQLNYFVYDNDLTYLQPCFTMSLNKVIDSIKKTKDTSTPYLKKHPANLNEYDVKNKEMGWLTNQLGLGKFNRNESNDASFTYTFEVKNSRLLATKGYDYVLSFNDRIIDADSVLLLKADDIDIKQTADTSRVYTIYLNNDKLSFNAKGYSR